MRILLVSPPLCQPAVPNLAIEELAEVARRAGHAAETLHAALCQPRSFRDDLIHGIGAQACFTPLYFGLDPNAFCTELTDAVLADFTGRDPVSPNSALEISEKFFFGMLDAEECLAEILAKIPARVFDVIGFSVGFDAQKMPAAVIAKALRQRGETATIVVGGTGTDEEMGPALLERFDEFDLVLQGEVDESWPMLLAALDRDGSVDAVPGCVYRCSGTIHSVPERAPSKQFMAVTVPDYSSFLRQRADSRYADSKLCLLIETSRGCWWGRKHHCTFCGIRSVDSDYRARDAASVADMFTTLWDRYEPDLLYATDAIVPADAHKTTWPTLYEQRRAGRDWRIFYETKSNMHRREIARMAAAGITRVQPGIESFRTHSLQLMDKGTTAVQQLNYLKWAHTYGVTVNYGIINGMPGETADDLRFMTRLSRKLWHLPPPADVNRLALHRFSPHYKQPEKFGIAQITPFRTQRVTYRCADDLVRRLCYQLDFRVPDQVDDDYETARTELINALIVWREAYLAGAGVWLYKHGDARVIGRGSSSTDFGMEVITDPAEVAVLDACEERASVERIAARAGLPPEDIERAVLDLEMRDLLFVEDGQALSLAVLADRDPVVDAGWHLELSVAAIGNVAS